MRLDPTKIDEAALALLLLTASGQQAWKGFSFEILDRLVERGWIEKLDPTSATLTLSSEGLKIGKEAQERLFADD